MFLTPIKARWYLFFPLAAVTWEETVPVTLFLCLFTLSFSPPQVFHDVAYKAKDRNDLVAGIDEFLDQVTVLPPGEWDPSIRIEPPKNVPSQVGFFS